jgi:hypothetical protein
LSMPGLMNAGINQGAFSGSAIFPRFSLPM